MVYPVEVSRDAREDILSITEYYVSRAGVSVASEMLNSLEEAINSLADLPERGRRPHELYATDERSILEIIVGHFRIIYQFKHERVTIFAALDGRQDVKTHLLKRCSRIR